MIKDCSSCRNCEHARQLVNSKLKDDNVACHLAQRFESHEEFLIDLSKIEGYSMYYKTKGSINGVMTKGAYVDADDRCKEYKEKK